MRAVLTYHSIDSSGSPISVTEEDFRAQVELLRREAVQVVPLSRILDLPPSQDAVAITFDDGLESFARVAAPILLSEGFPVTVFVVPGHVGGVNDWAAQPESLRIPKLPVLGWGQLEALAGKGVEIGAHTMTHPDLTALSDEALRAEIGGSVDTLRRRLGDQVRSFAYPFGLFDEKVVEEARGWVDCAVTTELDTLPVEGADPYRIPRLDMVYLRSGRMLGTWGTPWFRAYLGLRRRLRGIRRFGSGLAGGGGPFPDSRRFRS